MQQVLAFETDLLEYDDIFDGSHVIEARTAELVDAAQAELDEVLALGGAFEAIDELKGRLVRVEAERTRRIESGEQVVVGVNRFTETDAVAAGRRRRRSSRSTPRWRPRWSPTSRRGGPAATRRGRRRARRAAARAASSDENVMPATIALAHAGGTTGEWAGALREVFGEFRAPTGVGAAAAASAGELAAVAERVQGAAGRAAPAARGQARPRRPLQRRRADRGRRPRRRHGGHLPGHPPDARADRRRRPATRTST